MNLQRPWPATWKTLLTSRNRCRTTTSRSAPKPRVEALEERIACDGKPTWTDLTCPDSTIKAGQTTTLTARVTALEDDPGLTGNIQFQDTSDKVQLYKGGVTGTGTPCYDFPSFSNIGPHKLQAQFTDGGDYADSISNTICLEVTPGNPNQIIIEAPSSVPPDEPFDLTVKICDAYGNTVPDYTGTVHFTSSDLGATLPADYPFIPADQGQHTFSVTLHTPGLQMVTATDIANPALSGTANIQVLAGPPQGLVVFGFPAQTQSGAAHTFTVEALDAFGNVAPTYTGTVVFSSSDQRASLPRSYTFTTDDAGIHSFTATLETPGLQSLTVTDPTADFTSSQDGILVLPARFVLSGFPSPVSAGARNRFVLRAVDAAGNPDPGYSGTVHFASSDLQADLPADYTFTSSDRGTHVFLAGLKTAGVQWISATDLAWTDVTGMQSGIQVDPGPVSHLRLRGLPTPVYSGNPFNFTVAATDDYDNVVPTYGDSVSFGSSDSRATLPSPWTFTAADRGVHSFTATLRTLGDQSITVGDVQARLFDTGSTRVINPGNGPGGGFSPPAPPAGHQPAPAPPPDPGSPPPLFHERKGPFFLAPLWKKRDASGVEAYRFLQLLPDE
jgi:hypothetical protein